MNFPGYALLTCKISNTMLRITFFSMIMQTEVYVINIKGVARGGGAWGARDPPFVSRFLLKQPTIFRLRKREYPLFDRV